MNRRLIRVLVSGTFFGIAICAGTLDAQHWEKPLHAASPTWGAGNQTAFAVHAREFVIPNAGQYQDVVYCASTSCTGVTGIHLQHGASVTGIELDAYDATGNGQISCALMGCPLEADSCDNLETVATGVSFDLGNTLQYVLSVDPETIDNAGFSYFVTCGFTWGTDELRLRSFRVYYELQVSPAPLEATFGDVPTDHWAFQYVEALAASGITAGCGGGDYCPNDTVTRAQMAVFLSAALGLHWAN